SPRPPAARSNSPVVVAAADGAVAAEVAGTGAAVETPGRSTRPLPVRPSSAFRAGCLQKFVHVWKEHDAPESVTNIISGFRLPLTATPSLLPAGHLPTNLQARPSSEMDDVLKELLDLGAVAHIPPVTPGFLSR